MEKTKLDEILKLLEEVKQKVCSDTYDLTRDDHDAIIVRIDYLKQFIQHAYESHKAKKD